jgi:hypothetical protein
MTAGGGVRLLDILGSVATTTALELGLEPRFFFGGDFGNGFYVGWSNRFARDLHAL